MKPCPLINCGRGRATSALIRASKSGRSPRASAAFGFTNPVLIDGENRIMAGHGRVEAARELGMATAPCLRVEHLSAAEKRAYVLADNKLALNAGWDEELLALELKELMEADIEFDVECHRLLDRRGRPACRRPCAGGGWRSGRRQAS